MVEDCRGGTAGMCKDSRCVMCDSKEVEDLGRFLVDCEKFQGGRWLLLDRVRNIEGAGEWVDFFESGSWRQGGKGVTVVGGKGGGGR